MIRFCVSHSLTTSGAPILRSEKHVSSSLGRAMGVEQTVSGLLAHFGVYELVCGVELARVNS